MASVHLPMPLLDRACMPGGIPSFSNPTNVRPSSRKLPRLRISNFQSFLDLKPESKQETLNIDLPLHSVSDRSEYDVAVIGAGPAGLRLAESVSRHGVRVCCVDPSPLLMWPNNYGVWVDEFDDMALSDCLDHVWPLTAVIIDDHNKKLLDRPYGRVSRRALKTKLLESCLSTHNVAFHKARAWTVEHEEFKSTVRCSDGAEVRANLVVDASGFSTTLVACNKRRNPGFQIAHGIVAEVEKHPFDLDEMVLMDWRNGHLGNEPGLRASNEKLPTFLYAMPLTSELVFLEETSLVSRPVLSYTEIKQRMVARLQHMGIKVKRVVEEEKCVIPMGGPLPIIPQSVVAIGGAGGLVHPSTGYMVAGALAAALPVATAVVECMGSARMIRGRPMHGKVWGSLWPAEKRLAREFYCFGMETLLRLDLKGTRRFFDAFFDLEPRHWHGFLSSRLSLAELAGLSVSLFGRASAMAKLDIVTKCPLPLAGMLGRLAIETI